MIPCSLRTSAAACPIVNSDYRLYFDANNNRPAIGVGSNYSDISIGIYSEDRGVGNLVTDMVINPLNYDVYFDDVQIPRYSGSDWVDPSNGNELWLYDNGQYINDSVLYVRYPTVGDLTYSLNLKIYRLGVLDSEINFTFEFNSVPVSGQPIDTILIDVISGTKFGHVKYDQGFIATSTFQGKECPTVVTTTNYPIVVTKSLRAGDANDSFDWGGEVLEGRDMHLDDDDIWVNFPYYTGTLNGSPMEITTDLAPTGNTLYMVGTGNNWNLEFQISHNGSWRIKDDSNPADPTTAHLVLYNREGILVEDMTIQGFDFVGTFNYAASIKVTTAMPSGVPIVRQRADFGCYIAGDFTYLSNFQMLASPVITEDFISLTFYTNGSTNNTLDMVDTPDDYTVEIDGETQAGIIGQGTKLPGWIFNSHNQFNINCETELNSGLTGLHIDNPTQLEDVTSRVKIYKLGTLVSDTEFRVQGSYVPFPNGVVADSLTVTLHKGNMFGDKLRQDQGKTITIIDLR